MRGIILTIPIFLKTLKYISLLLWKHYISYNLGLYIYEWTLKFKSTEVGEGSLFTCPSDVKVGEDSLFMSSILTGFSVQQSITMSIYSQQNVPPNDLSQVESTAAFICPRDLIQHKYILLKITWYIEYFVYILHFMSSALPGVKLDTAQWMHFVSVHSGT